MGFTKTIIQRFSDTTAFSFIDFIIGTLSLIQYGIDNNINVRINLDSSPLSEFIITENYDTHDVPCINSEDVQTNLDAFKEDTTALLVVCTNWSTRVSVMAIEEFKSLIEFTPAIYSEANSRVASELLNINLPHTNPIIQPFVPGLIPGDYSVIYVDINSSTTFNYLDTLQLADFIRSSLFLNKNILLLSNDKRMKLWLSRILEVNYIPGPVNEPFVPLNSWTLKDEIVNFILLAESKRTYIFTELALPVNKFYEYPVKMLGAPIQRISFFYSKVDISPMPGF